MIPPKASGIYRIACLPTNKFYIGSAQDFRRRWSEHRRRLNAGKHPNTHLQHAWNKYGEASFAFDVLEIVMFVEHLIEREQFYLDMLRPYDDTIGFNIGRVADAPMRGRKMSAEHRARQSAARKGRIISEEERLQRSVQRKGKPMPWLRTPEVNAKIAAAHRGKTLTEAHRQNVANAKRGWRPSAETIENMKKAASRRTAETRQKMSDAAKRRPPPSPETRQKNADAQRQRPKIARHIVTMPDGEELLVYLPAFCLEHNLSYSTLKAYAHKYPRKFKGYMIQLVKPRATDRP